ncbi:MAG TPA: hypothetical protein VJ825_09555 [Gemmatimonadaceae bacterium]|nr:hypothetical protein [Gemmatimonadaceae bacterium]
MSDPNRTFVRHMLATIAYRAAKVERDAPSGFADFSLGKGSRTAVELLAHMGDLLDWALRMAQGGSEWTPQKPRSWRKEVERFHASLLELDRYLASDAPLGTTVEELFQGPISDVLTHIGQLAMLRRQDLSPVRSEVYVKADIASGRVGLEQAKSAFEFDGPPAAG